jgi:hypothetical protein
MPLDDSATGCLSIGRGVGGGGGGWVGRGRRRRGPPAAAAPLKREVANFLEIIFFELRCPTDST